MSLQSPLLNPKLMLNLLIKVKELWFCRDRIMKAWLPWPSWAAAGISNVEVCDTNPVFLHMVMRWCVLTFQNAFMIYLEWGRVILDSVPREWQLNDSAVGNWAVEHGQWQLLWSWSHLWVNASCWKRWPVWFALTEHGVLKITLNCITPWVTPVFWKCVLAWLDIKWDFGGIVQ